MKGLIFQAHSVKAMLAGRKTQSRRIVKPQPFSDWSIPPARFKTGGELYVKEAWLECNGRFEIYYKADIAAMYSDGGKWKNPLFMPERASRLTLTLTNLRCERINQITEPDAIAEGYASIADFRAAWDKMHGEGAFDAGGWVWALTFDVTRKETRA